LAFWPSCRRGRARSTTTRTRISSSPRAGSRPAKLRDALAQAGFAAQIPPAVWERRWTVHVQQIGHGDHAVRYLARYVFHVALTNARIRRFEHNRVTFSYTHAHTQETRQLTLPVDAFIERFLQHVLPRGFTKIRYFGLLSPSCRPKLDHARHLLELHTASDLPPNRVAATDSIDSTSPTSTASLTTVLRCPTCHRGRLYLIEHVGRPRAPP
jgi:hypothetical protein